MTRCIAQSSAPFCAAVAVAAVAVAGVAAVAAVGTIL